MYNKKLKEYKERQTEINEEMQRYTDADESYYVTANTVLNLAKRAYEIFKSSEVSEKRQLLSFLLQNPVLDGKELAFTLTKPFDSILEASKCSSVLPIVNAFRTINWKEIMLEMERFSFVKEREDAYFF